MLQEQLPDDLKWIDNVDAAYHQKNTSEDKPNRKYVSFDGHFELIYDHNNILLTSENDPLNMGTYNYAHPTKDPVNHFLKDVKPFGALWIKWGNIPEHANKLYE